MTQTNDPKETFYQPDEEPAKSLEPGTPLADRYKLVKQIGRGGMGVVWSAEEIKAQRKVVLKFVPHDLKNFESAVAQLRESFDKIHALQHQHICPIYTLEEDDHLGYYHVMKWLDGETLDEYVGRTVGRQQPLPFDEALRILRPIAEALDYAHDNRIIHRDIKPSNVFIVHNEEKAIHDVQVIDFGLASEIRSSLSRVSQMRFDNAGTRPYMAPEQWRARPQTAATDQYALAVMAYELLAGHLPFEGDDLEMLRMAVMQDPPEPIEGMPEHVNAALLKALAKDGGARFESCTEFIAALGGAEIAVIPRARGVSQGNKSRNGAQRNDGIPQPILPGVESLMTRGHLALEDSEWEKANKFFDDVLNLDAKYAPAYIGLLCTELKVQQEEFLGDHEKPISEHNNFKKAIRFAAPEYKATIEGYDEKIRERIRREQELREEQKHREKQKRQEQYERLVEEAKMASTEEEWLNFATQFLAMNGYKNTVELAEQCHRRAERKRRGGTRFVVSVNNTEYPFRWCPPGTFMMGSPSSEEDRSNDEVQHQVTLTQGFWMLETPVTQAMWESVMGNNPSHFKGAKLPVEQVSWNDCQGYINKLNTLLAGTPSTPPGYKFSLPTEAQWEYACRAGTTTPFHFGSVLNGDKANCNGNYPYGTTTTGKYLEKTSVVGSYPANAWGLYDMHGNVWEWCSDWYGNYPSSAVTDPTGVSSGSSRVLRGGSWYYCHAQRCRSAFRLSYDPSDRRNFIGLRLALVREE